MPTDADPDAVCEKLEGDEFIFDVQTHHVDPEGPWVKESPATAQFFARFLGGDPSCMEADKLDCISRFYYAHDIFLESDTTMAVLSDTPTSTDNSDPLNFDEMKRTRDIINQLSPPNTDRMKLHSVVVPNAYADALQDQLDRMQARAEAMDVAAWKIYTPYAPNGTGWQLDDEALGIPVIEKARELGREDDLRAQGAAAVRLRPRGRVAARHRRRREGVSGHELRRLSLRLVSGHPRGAVQRREPAGRRRARSRACSTTACSRTPTSTPSWVRRGATSCRDTTQAAHLLGKLLKYCGEDNVLWGTDCIWTGSPQPQIAAFRAFKIDPQFAAPVRLSGANGRGEAQDLRTERGAPVRRRSGRRRRCRIDGDEIESLRAAWRDLEGDTHELRWTNRNPTDRAGHAALVRPARQQVAVGLSIAQPACRSLGDITRDRETRPTCFT